MPSYLSICAALILLVFLWMVWRASPHKLINRRFTVFAVSIASWAIAVAVAHTGHCVGGWTAIAFASACFSSAAFLGFVAAHEPTAGASQNNIVRIAFALADLYCKALR